MDFESERVIDDFMAALLLLVPGWNDKTERVLIRRYKQEPYIELKLRNGGVNGEQHSRTRRYRVDSKLAERLCEGRFVDDVSTLGFTDNQKLQTTQSVWGIVKRFWSHRKLRVEVWFEGKTVTQHLFEKPDSELHIGYGADSGITVPCIEQPRLFLAHRQGTFFLATYPEMSGVLFCDLVTLPLARIHRANMPMYEINSMAIGWVEFPGGYTFRLTWVSDF